MEIAENKWRSTNSKLGKQEKAQGDAGLREDSIYKMDNRLDQILFYSEKPIKMKLPIWESESQM